MEQKRTRTRHSVASVADGKETGMVVGGGEQRVERQSCVVGHNGCVCSAVDAILNQIGGGSGASIPYQSYCIGLKRVEIKLLHGQTVGHGNIHGIEAETVPSSCATECKMPPIAAVVGKSEGGVALR